MSINRKNAMQSLLGTAIGDGFGQSFFIPEDQALTLVNHQQLPEPIWYFTDDTVMTISIVESLIKFGNINQDFLAQRFADRYQEEPNRGYGGTAHKILREIGEGRPWREAADDVFSGMGSKGNGGAMRAAPIGAYFAGDTAKIITEAVASAEVTHSHPDAQAGTIAVALAAGYIVENAGISSPESFFNYILEYMPGSDTRSRIVRAANLSSETNNQTLVSRLGNGIELCAFDTVPIALWVTAHYSDDFQAASWRMVSVMGDRDTTCAIVGGLVALSSSPADNWALAAEPLPSI